MGIKKGGSGKGGAGKGKGGGGGGGGSTFKWCKRHGLQENRLYEMAKLQQQFQDMLQAEGRGRRRAHGDAARRQQLRVLQQEAERQRGRRVLRLDAEGGVEDEDGGEEADGDGDEFGGSLMLDVRRLDFELGYRLDAPAQIGRELSARDCNLMKLAIAASFYPNWAIADENNYGKKASDIVFHTKLKKFVKLHPASSCAADPESACGPLELLCYTQLLETNHAYLLHPMPVTGLHALLLFSRSVHTDPACTRIVCDGWLQLRLRNGAAGERCLLIAHQLRLLWARLMRSKLRRRDTGAAKKTQDAESKTETDGVDGKGWHEDRTGDEENAKDEAEVQKIQAEKEKQKQLQAEEDERKEEEAAGHVRRISAAKLAKLPRFAQHVYNIRSLPPLRDAALAPDQLLADKLSAFMACPVEYVLERAKLSELAKELGLTSSAAGGDADESEEGVQAGQSARAKNAKRRKHGSSDGSDGGAMRELETQQQLAAVSQSGGLSSARRTAANCSPENGHRLAPWLHYGSLQGSVDSLSAVGGAGGSAEPDREESAAEEMQRFMGLQEHKQKTWRCPRCKLKLQVTLPEARRHDISCRVVMKKMASDARPAVPKARARPQPAVGAATATRKPEGAADERARPEPAPRPAQTEESSPRFESREAPSPAEAPVAAAEGSIDERLAHARRYFLVRASAKDRKVGLRRSPNLEDLEPDGSTGLLADSAVVEAVEETATWIRLACGRWLPKEFARSVETYENVLRYQR